MATLIYRRETNKSFKICASNEQSTRFVSYENSSGADLSTLVNCLPWDFYYNNIQNTNILGGAAEIFLTSKLLLFIPEFFKNFVE